MAHRQTSTIRLFREQHVNIPITFLRAKQLCPSKKHIEQSGHWYSANTQPLKNLEARQRLDMRQLRLTKSEERIRALMLDVSADINKSKTPGTSLTVTRFTGGWVRDKLLGEESHDIDVSISDMTGAKFVESVRDYLAKPENAKAHNFQENEISRLASYIVSSNPDKSKHLETANMRLFLKEVDFVNLRKEQYAKDSRTPIMEFGTAQEDAFRRDATLNALFYNLDTEEVEDWTRTGLEDLSTGLLRTPLDPMQTFDDDPLRALRLIRFASRLGFTIEPKAEASMASIGIKESLKTKISRERVQIEITKMLKSTTNVRQGTGPAVGLSIIDRLGMYGSIFMSPTTPDRFLPSTVKWHHIYNFLAVLTESNDTLSSPTLIAPSQRDLDIIKSTLMTKQSIYLEEWLLAALVPWTDSKLKCTSKTEKTPAGKVAREALKMPNSLCKIVDKSFSTSALISKLCIDFSHTARTIPPSRRELGWAFYQLGDNGRYSVLLALLQDLYAVDPASPKKDAMYRQILDRWTEFLTTVTALDLLNAYKLSCAVDGKDIMEHFNQPPGKWIQRALEMVTKWQFEQSERCKPNRNVSALKKDALGMLDDQKAEFM